MLRPMAMHRLPSTAPTGAAVPAVLGLLLLALSGVAGGCGNPYEVDSTSDLGALSRGNFPTVAIAPPLYLMEYLPHEPFLYTWDLVDALTVDGGVPVIAPWEYDATGRTAASSREEALIALADLEQAESIADLVLLEVRLDEEMMQRVVREPATVGGGVRRDYESEMTLRLTLRGFPAGRELASVLVEFENDPYADGTNSANPHPLVGGAMRAAAEELVRLMRERWPNGASGGAPDVVVTYNPQPLFAYRPGTGASVGEELAALDDLDRSARRLAYYQYFDEDLIPAEVARFDALGGGLLVREVGEHAGLRLQPGDYITSVAGLPVDGPQSLWRPFLEGRRGDAVPVTLLRGAEVVDVTLRVMETSN
jgi:hypothetical protein